MRDNLGQLFDIRWLKVNHLVRLVMILQVPQIDAQVVRREEVFAVGANAQWINVVVVTIFKLFAFHAFIARAKHLRLWEHNLVVSIHRAVGVLALHAILQLPQLYDPIVCRQELKFAALGRAEKFEGVYFLVELQALQMVKLGLVGLNFTKVPIIEVARVLQVSVPEDDDAAASVTNG